MFKFPALVIICALGLSAQPPLNIYAGGVSWNPSATPVIAGTGLYARLISGGTYAFTAIDALPTTVKPLVVTTQISTGIAQRVATIGGVAIYCPTSAGVSYNGTNVGWAWTTGGLASVRLRGAWHLMPNVRVVKSSVSNGTGYQVICGLLLSYSQ